MKAKAAQEYIDNNKTFITGAADKIWEFAELPFKEVQSSEYLAKILEDEGFRVERAVAGIPTAFVATWGEGSPVIGYMGEYDALAELSQKAVPYRAPRVPGGGGHACGHNLLGVAPLGAAIALKRQMESEGAKGTVKYYGCPAEEGGGGKVYMAHAGLFDECDAALSWHPRSWTRVTYASCLATTRMDITFKGRSAAASTGGYNGRSALDAVQLMNLGVEFIREHMVGKARIHYVILKGGEQPNVVPALAKVRYQIRCPDVPLLRALEARVMKCASGAAKMTETEYEVTQLGGTWNILNNTVIERVLFECMERVGPPQFGPKEHEFAEEIAKTFADRDGVLKSSPYSPQELKYLRNRNFCDMILPIMPRTIEYDLFSTDIGDVSWVVPTGQIETTCVCLGTTTHSWQWAAQVGMGIGHAGLITATKILAEAGFELMKSPKILEEAKAEFHESTEGAGIRYEPMLSHWKRPVFELFDLEK